MDYLLWIAPFLWTSVFADWVLFLGGADWLEGWFLSGFLVHFRAPSWTADGLELFVGLAWFASSVWFAVGVFSPPARRFFLY